MKRISLALGLLGLLAAATPADAATATASLAVSTTVNRVCTIGAATLSFPAYSPDTGVGTTSQALAVKCNRGFAPTIAIDNGQNFGATRRMANGSDLLGYTLQLRSGISSGDSVTAASADASGNVAVSVEGSIPAGQWVSAAATPYQDVVTMTVTF
jgi:spore coat protein U-like protein